MSEANENEKRVDVSRRDFLRKSAPVLAVAGVGGLATSEAVGQEKDDNVSRKVGHRVVHQNKLSRIMLKAESAVSRIGKGIAGGMLDEVAAGAKELEAIMRATADVQIGQSAERQTAWTIRAIEVADNTKKLNIAAEEAIRRGEREISAGIVELYAREISLEAGCHRDFRIQV